MSLKDSVSYLSSKKSLQYDSETTGLNPHSDKLVCIQFGKKSDDIQIVVDTETVPVSAYKSVLENTLLIMHNGKFDLQFLYSQGIVPRKVYDTMIVEQLLYLGYPKGKIGVKFGLSHVLKRRLKLDMDKSIREQIASRGLDASVIKYSANDVVYLEDIMHLQVADCKRKECSEAMKLECLTVPATAYMEWCGVLLDVPKWREKMKEDLALRDDRAAELNDFVVSREIEDEDFIDFGGMFAGLVEPKCRINWKSPKQVVPYAAHLGFNTKVKDKATGKMKDSVLEKVLKPQKGVCDDFLKLYFNFKEADKLVSSFGQTHIDAIDPATGRIHTDFHQLGAASGRYSCGGKRGEKKLPNLQQLPHDERTRSCFIAPEGCSFISCDYSSEEARLAGDIYQDKAILKMFRDGIDSHSFYAKTFFPKELAGVDVHDVKKLRPDLRTLAKGPEFALNFGGGANAIMQALQCSQEKADEILSNYEKTFKGTVAFAKKGAKELMDKGYVLINPITGHKMYWADIEQWKKFEAQTKLPGFWDDYNEIHKPRKDAVYDKVRTHHKALSKWERMVRNAPTQGTGACILKTALTELFDWIVNNGYFGKIHICVAVHDEINCDFPSEIQEFPAILKEIMEKASAKFCSSLDIPAEPSVGTHWIH
jgi:DNA polymerase I-like protein with 3'-5' exonuclease and polymerase domains